MTNYDASVIKEDLDRVLSIILNGKPTEVSKHTIDVINLIKHFIVNRLNQDDYEFNDPKVLNIINIEPSFRLIVVKVKVGTNITILGTELITI